MRKALHRASLSLGPSSDRRLANRASEGDRRAIAAIFERYQQELYAFCLGILGEPEDAQDALQNTMVKVLRALPGEEREIALRPWLYRIAHNEAVELRRTRRPTQTLDGHLVDGQSSVAERAEQREQLQWLLWDLTDLPERQRTVLVMRELNGLDFADIAAALDTTAAVVRQALYEARRNLEQIGHGRGLRCDAVTRVLSDADGRITRRRDIRAHLRDCPECRRFQEAIESRRGILAAIPPLPAAAAGLLQATIGGSSSGVGAAALTGGAAKSAGACGALKVAGTVAAVAVLGTSAVRFEMRSESPDPAPRQAQLPARVDPPSSPSASRGKQRVQPGRPAEERQVFAASAGGRAALAAERRKLNVRPSSPGQRRALVLKVSGRPLATPLAAGPPEVLSVASPPASQVEESDPSPNDEQGEDQGRDDEGKGREDQPGRPPKPEKQPVPQPQAAKKAKPEHPSKPDKQSPGQAKKAAQGQAPMPETQPAPAPQASPEAASAEPPSAAEGTGPNGKAKGHDKPPVSATDLD